AGCARADQARACGQRARSGPVRAGAESGHPDSAVARCAARRGDPPTAGRSCAVVAAARGRPRRPGSRAAAGKGGDASNGPGIARPPIARAVRSAWRELEPLVRAGPEVAGMILDLSAVTDSLIDLVKDNWSSAPIWAELGLGGPAFTPTFSGLAPDAIRDGG